MTDRETPDGAQPGDDRNADAAGRVDDERERLEAAERRGMGRGTVIGLGVAVLVVLLTAIVLFWWNPFAQSEPAPDNTVPVTSLPAPSAEPTSSIPLSTATVVPPATTAPPATTQPPTQPASIALALNRWNWLPDQQAFSVGGFVEVVESGGTCSLTATNGPLTLVAIADATADVTTTICVVNLHSPDITSGDWQLMMTYDGPSGHATSDTVTVTVP